FFRPLVDLDPGEARVFLGIVLPIDGVPGLRRRMATASRYLDDFGVALYCGFRTEPGTDGAEAMRHHAQTVRAVRARQPELARLPPAPALARRLRRAPDLTEMVQPGRRIPDHRRPAVRNPSLRDAAGGPAPSPLEADGLRLYRLFQRPDLDD